MLSGAGMVPVAGTGIGQDWTDSTTLQWSYRKDYEETVVKYWQILYIFWKQHRCTVAGIVAGAQKMAP